ncbi:MAG: MotA/TolQ/ExbB proton channel family protein [Candidatus Brocadiales bacterium]|nr:MotA/TolQ/ExbB proton channel family protein [Candidatus Brocadiales bacterium]
MNWILGGGPVMIPLLICSVIALAVILERAISLRKRRIIKPELVRLVQEIRDVGDVPVAFSKCQMVRGPFSNLIRHVLMNLHLSWEEKLHEIQIAGKEEAKTLERNLTILEGVAAIAPLLGLLGTILGLSEIFDVVAKRGLGEPKAFSYGIAQALRTTILGLAIAIPSIIASNFFDQRVDSLVHEMERLSTILLNKLYASKVRKEVPGRFGEVKLRDLPEER